MQMSRDQEDITRVGPGTVMGQFMREYWIPALKSNELVAGGDPIRLLLLGEKLVAFRDQRGAVGVMDHRCPHRGVSLFMGRVEEDGLRCVYHGWKFDAAGRCIEMPSVPEHQDFKEKVRTISYRAVEKAGLIWVYMGSRRDAPPLPELEVLGLPEDEIDVIFLQRQSNWLQNLEGEIDTAHFNFLHVGGLNPDDVPPGHPLEYTAQGAPAYQVKNTELGTCYAAQTTVDDARLYTRFAHYMFPFWALIPQGGIQQNVLARAWVPMDDAHTMMVFIRWNRSGVRPLNEPLKHGEPLPGVTLTSDFEYQPTTTDWYGRWRPMGNESNDWLIDREAQREGLLFSGIRGIHAQDQAMTDSMGAITDHAWEQLGPSDLMVARTRRRILQAARAFRDQGGSAPGVDQPELYGRERSGYYITPATVDWQQAYAEQLEIVNQRRVEAAQATS